MSGRQRSTSHPQVAFLSLPMAVLHHSEVVVVALGWAGDKAVFLSTSSFQMSLYNQFFKRKQPQNPA